MDDLERLRFCMGWDKPDPAALMKHATKMTDAEIDRDFDDCVLPLAQPEDVDLLKQYATQRKRAPYFGPGKKGANNHEHIPVAPTRRKRKTPV